MPNLGFHHIGLATHDMEATLEFYEDILGFDTQVCDVISPAAGGTIRHAFLDAGNGEMIAFMECNDVEGIADGFDTGINRGLGISGGVMHFSFKAASVEDLQARRDDLLSKNIKVTEVVDHGWCQSIYFKDPNHLQLEFCVVTEVFEERHLGDKNTESWRSLSRR
ncbi:MAG TPA: VOC family protein [Gammaproteobacteria bacterium]|nr:VOC family protein [Gammaproteobacteria bacterium]